MTAANPIIERVARESYGRLLSFLMARSRDWFAAEDALGHAFRCALETWPVAGFPEKPEAWLLVVARRHLTNTLRQADRYREADVAAFSERKALDGDQSENIPDERLHMLFLCAHPALDRNLHTPLMLQAVLGFTSERIASAFLVKPATMAQRLSRVKAKIRAANIRFDLPERSRLPARLNAVLEAVYAAYNAGWDDLDEGSGGRPRGLAGEAVYLGRLLDALLPDEPEVQGLMALMLFCESRKQARRSPSGSYVPLAEQSIDVWSKADIVEAEQHLARAAGLGCLGRFQLEAAIQSVHAHRMTTGNTDWHAIVQLYQALLQLAPTIGARVGHAAAIAEAYGSEEGLRWISAVPAEQTARHQPYWALVAHLKAQMGQHEQARLAYDRATGLCEDPAVRQFLIEKASRLDALGNPTRFEKR